MYINGKKLSVRRFSSGELKLLRSTLDSFIINNRVQILYENTFSFFELMLILNYYKGKDVLIDLILTYLPYQRMDHKGRDELDTINYVFEFINSLKLNSVMVCEPHCDISLLDNGKVFSFVKKLKNIVFEEIKFDLDRDIVVLADKGGVKRYGDIAKNIVYFNKVRDEETGLIIDHRPVGDVDAKRKIVIVDDIISTGDTIVNIIEKLSELGVDQIYVLSGHIENNKYNRRIFSFKNVKGIYSSNSLKKKSISKLKLFDVYDLLKEEMN